MMEISHQQDRIRCKKRLKVSVSLTNRGNSPGRQQTYHRSDHALADYLGKSCRLLLSSKPLIAKKTIVLCCPREMDNIHRHPISDIVLALRPNLLMAKIPVGREGLNWPLSHDDVP